MPYGYKKDNDTSVAIDWSVIGSDIAKTITGEVEDRAAKKQKFDDDSRAFLKEISNVELGDDVTRNAWVLKGTDQVKQTRLMQDRLLKKGLLKVRDYTVGRQNLTDGMKSLAAVSEEYNVEYAEHMKRMQEGVSGEAERWKMEQIEGYANFKKSGIYVNPKTGQVNLAMKKEDGSLDTRAGSIQGIESLRNRLNSKQDKYDLDGAVNKLVDDMGRWVQSTGLDPKQSTVEDMRQIDGWDAALTDYTEAMLVDPNNVQSILTDFLNEDFFLTTDPKEKDNPNAIFMKKDSHGQYVPELDPYQEQAAREKIKSDFEMKMTHVEKAREPKTATGKAQTSVGAAKEVKENEALIVERMATRIFGRGLDQANIDAGIGELNAFLLSKNMQIERTADGAKIIKTNSNGDYLGEVPIPMTDEKSFVDAITLAVGLGAYSNFVGTAGDKGAYTPTAVVGSGEGFDDKKDAHYTTTWKKSAGESSYSKRNKKNRVEALTKVSANILTMVTDEFEAEGIATPDVIFTMFDDNNQTWADGDSGKPKYMTIQIPNMEDVTFTIASKNKHNTGVEVDRVYKELKRKLMALTTTL